MKQSVYDEIMQTIRNGPKIFSINCARHLIHKYPEISPNTLYSILSLEGQKTMKRKYGILMRVASEYANNWKKNKAFDRSSGVLLRAADQANVPPALLIKHLLEKYYDPKFHAQKAKLSKVVSDSSVIDDKFLAFESFLCILNDYCYGPISVSIGDSIGKEYEVKLRDHMIKNNIAFVDEEYLRIRGYDKTPDVKLEVPIAVDGVVINWIESKARFGSEEIHNEYMKQQYCAYWNRFGPGLIIYWFDFVETLNQNNEKRFIIMNDLPKNIVHIKLDDSKISFL